jgi:hypothetical protein
MYSPRQVLKGLRWTVTEPRLVGRELNRLYHRRGYRRSYNTAGVDAMAEDWDVLALLDACRLDLFRAEHDLPGRLRARVSRGSHTSEFVRGNFHGRSFPDAVYVTASPILGRGLGEKYETSFHDRVDVWAEDGWDPDHGTVLPETTTDYALRAAERYPNKRLVVHYMQPHYPFVGDQLLPETVVPDPATLDRDVWTELTTGEDAPPPERVREAYRSNLRRALPAVRDLLAGVTGRVVVTADHGNMLGERASPVPVREWGHPPGVYTPELVRVPWLVHDAGPRPTIRAGDRAGETDAVDDAVVTDRLRHLGYAE